mgnify:CR=1 FL=1|jgi:glycosyltransferase involved in cell wall biosynthesis
MPQTNKEISIILSVYNGEKFIEKTLRSILNQRFINFECIIIDDGSTDNTKSIIHDIIEGKKNFTYFFKQNGGYVSARNFGYSKINNETKYIHFMDADDILAPNYYSTLIQLLDKNPKISAICSNHDLIDVNDQRIGDSHYSPFIISTRFGYKILQGQYFRIPFISIFCWGKIIEPMVIMRISAYAKTTGWDPRFGKGKGNIGDGILLFGEIALGGEIWFLNQVLYHYRKHSNQSTSDPQLNQLAQKKVLSIWKEKYKNGIINNSEYYFSKIFFNTRFQMISIKGSLKHELRYTPLKFVFSLLEYCLRFFLSIPLAFYRSQKISRLF